MKLVAYNQDGAGGLYPIRGLRPVSPAFDCHPDYVFVQVADGQVTQLYRKSEVLFSVATDNDLADPDIETYDASFIFQPRG